MPARLFWTLDEYSKGRDDRGETMPTATAALRLGAALIMGVHLWVGGDLAMVMPFGGMGSRVNSVSSISRTSSEQGGGRSRAMRRGRRAGRQAQV